MANTKALLGAPVNLILMLLGNLTSNILEIVESTKLKQLEAQYFINLL